MQKLVLILFVVGLLAACSQPKTEIPSTTPAAVEMGDSAKANLAKASYLALIAGDVDGFAASMSDDAVFYWNSGDSLIGKAAIVEYWKDRRANVIDTLKIWDDIWVPLKVNALTNAPSGEYVLMWAMLSSNYQFGGKTGMQRFHQVYRFNNEGKINHITHYIDRYDVAEALRPQKK